MPTGWVHVVWNFIGPNDGEGFQLFNNGVKARATIDASRRLIPLNTTISSSRFLIGKLYYNTDGNYTSVKVDELFFYNRALTEAEITSLSANMQNL